MSKVQQATWRGPVTTLVVLTAVMVSGLAQLCWAADEALTEVKARYATAAYEEALGLLERVREPESRDEVDEYRALCLLALGREAEAERAVESLVARRPQLLVDLVARPPKFVALYQRVRGRLLPSIATAAYSDAKDRYDAGDYQGAVQRFKGAMALLEGATHEATGWAAGRDLRLLAVGFLSLAEARLAPPAPVPVEPVTLTVIGAPGSSALESRAVERAPAQPSGGGSPSTRGTLPPPPTFRQAVSPVATAAADSATSTASVDSATPRPVATTGATSSPMVASIGSISSTPSAPSRSSAVDAPADFLPIARVYDGHDADIVPPVILDQKLPDWIPPFELLRRRTFSGRLEVIVGTDGRVASAEIVQPAFNLYDERLLRATKQWRYQPATKRSHPVQYRRVIEYTLTGAGAK